MEYFKTFDEICNDLSAIKPLKKDLSQAQPISDVMPTVYKVMENLDKASNFDFTEKQQAVYSYLLKNLGMTTYKNANNCFIKDPKAGMSTVSKIPNNIEAALGVLTQIIDTDAESTNMGLAYANDREYIKDWLKAQEAIIAKENVENKPAKFEYFKDFDSIMKDLSSIKPLSNDLSQYSYIDDVMPTVKRAMVNLLAVRDYKFTEEEFNIYCKTLKNLGLRSFKEANECFKRDKFKLGVLIRLKNDIGFPLSALSQFIDKDLTSFNSCIDMMSGGDKNSWIADWLDTQGVKYDKISEYMDEYNKTYGSSKVKTDEGPTY